MTLLVLGVLVWSVAHLFPSAAVAARRRLIAKLGEQAYKGLFSLAILGSIIAMVFGWRSAPVTIVYVPTGWGYTVAELAVFVGLLLFAASGLPSNLKRVLRHPQLSGVVVWSGAHLLANGDRRSMVLFGGLGSWAVLAILLTNRRDGEWQKPQPVPIRSDLVPLLVAAVAWVVLFYAHPYFAGPTLSLPW